MWLARSAVMSESHCALNTPTVQIVRGSAARAMRVLGGLSFGIGALLGLAMWLFVHDTTRTKIAVEIALLMVLAMIVLAAAVAAASTVARVQDGSLDFFFCGMRMRSFAVDGSTTFDLHKIGRLEVLRIQRGPESYVPNGALDKDALVDLLRTNGVAERQAD
jgi:hypothetical protein